MLITIVCGRELFDVICAAGATPAGILATMRARFPGVRVASSLALHGAALRANVTIGEQGIRGGETLVMGEAR